MTRSVEYFSGKLHNGRLARDFEQMISRRVEEELSNFLQNAAFFHATVNFGVRSFKVMFQSGVTPGILE